MKVHETLDKKQIEDYLDIHWEIIIGIDVYRFEDQRCLKLEDKFHVVLLEGVTKPSNPTRACSQ